jgi:NitT/TauT family transport system ATP-binding protein
MPPVIELKNVTKRFRDRRNGSAFTAVDNLSLAIQEENKGQFIVLLGPSGCGKSTVLNLISGLLGADSGEVRVLGQLVTGPNPNSATVPQAYTCFPWLTALGNAEFGLAIQGMPKAERRQMAAKYLRKVGLADRLAAFPNQLSGGMQQRVAIARTLAMKPPVLLMDEPFGALDAQTRADMQQLLLDLWGEERNTVVFVTHDIAEALLLGDRIVVFSTNPARVILDLPLAIPRPRLSLSRDEDLINLSAHLLGLLKAPSPVRPTVGSMLEVMPNNDDQGLRSARPT